VGVQPTRALRPWAEIALGPWLGKASVGVNRQELWILGRARLEVPWLGGSSEALTETVRYLPH
jgi:hypothetical protein